MFGSMRADFGYPLGVIRPRRLAPRPLSGLAELLGVGRTEEIQNGFGILSGVTLDSRAVRPGDLYAALQTLQIQPQPGLAAPYVRLNAR